MEIISKSSMGELVISNEVISSIAINAAKDVDGVSSFYNGPADVMNTIKQGSLKVMSPIRIIPDGEDFSISIYINVSPGKKFQTVATLSLPELILTHRLKKNLVKVKINTV